LANQNPGEPTKKVCPSIAGGNNYWPSSYSPRTKWTYIPAMTACSDVTIDTAKHSKDKGWNGGAHKTADRYESNLTAIDPVTGEIKKTVHLQYPNYSGTVSKHSLKPDRSPTWRAGYFASLTTPHWIFCAAAPDRTPCDPTRTWT
jgi:hypothetical protein